MRENVICKMQLEIARNKRGSAQKCVSGDLVRIVMLTGSPALLLPPWDGGSGN